MWCATRSRRCSNRAACVSVGELVREGYIPVNASHATVRSPSRTSPPQQHHPQNPTLTTTQQLNRTIHRATPRNPVRPFSESAIEVIMSIEPQRQKEPTPNQDAPAAPGPDRNDPAIEPQVSDVEPETEKGDGQTQGQPLRPAKASRKVRIRTSSPTAAPMCLTTSRRKKGRPAQSAAHSRHRR